MENYKKKPVVIQAEQWYPANCYHSEDVVVQANLSPIGKPDKERCSHCDNPMEVHALCPTLEGNHIVCPSDYIIKGIKGEFYPCKEDIFKATYTQENGEEIV